jgi:hypothetical protein
MWKEFHILISIVLLVALIACVVHTAHESILPYADNEEENIVDLNNDFAFSKFQTGDILLCRANNATFFRKSLMGAPFTHVAIVHWNEAEQQPYVFQWGLSVTYIPLKRFVSSYTSSQNKSGEIFRWPIKHAITNEYKTRMDHYISCCASPNDPQGRYIDTGKVTFTVLDANRLHIDAQRTDHASIGAWGVHTTIVAVANYSLKTQFHTGTIALCSDTLLTLLMRIGVLNVEKWKILGRGVSSGSQLDVFDYRNGMLNLSLNEPFQYAQYIKKCQI